jgi:hypothetical protein
MKNTLLISLVAAALFVGTGLASAQVKTEKGDPPAAAYEKKGDQGMTDPKRNAAPEASEPKGGVKMQGQPEPKAPGTTK